MAEMFTPGPWSTNCSHIYAPDGAIIAQVHNPGSKASDYPLVANRDLMAAAPSLYEALRELRASCTRTAPAVHDDCGTRIVTAPTMDALKAASAALARARGEAE